MAVNGNSHKGKRILVPLFYEYYLFSYFQNLIPRLLDDGFNVTVFTFDRRVMDTYRTLDSRIQIVEGSAPLRMALNRSGRILFRFILWTLGWQLVWRLRKRYDFVLLPWDNKPLWYMMSRAMPAMTCHNTTEFLDIDLTLEHMYPSEKLLSSWGHRLMLLIDKIFGRKILPRINGRLLHYSNYLIIDRIMGFRSENYLHAFSKIDYFTMMGNRMKENYLHCGVGGPGHPTEITVTGSPSYEGILLIKEKFDAAMRRHVMASLGIASEKHLYSFFLSPSSFTEQQIEEVVQVVESVRDCDFESAFLLKFHPKTRKGDPERFRQRLKGLLGEDLVLMTEFGGDELNARLILSSECVLQKQGTVGFIAMLFQTPLISYDLMPTDYFDDMYRLLDGSFHCMSKEEIGIAVRMLSTKEGRRELARKQKIACERYCYPEVSPCQKISGIIQRHFQEDRISC